MNLSDSQNKPLARPSLDDLVEQVIASYDSDSRTEHIDSNYLPSREAIIELVMLLRRLVFPGFFDEHTELRRAGLRTHVTDLLGQVQHLLENEVDAALRYERNLSQSGDGDACEQCTLQAQQITDRFLEKLSELRAMLALDVQAAYDGDPAARNTDETVFCYPGLFAIFVYRIAHQLFALNVPLIPRIMSEHAHAVVGIDIHPGAQIGPSFFIDHGTGVVIGETTSIGKNVKLYQGVTLGALSFPKDERGRVIRGQKRHPTIEDEVTIYAGATVLGGNTVIGKGSVVGGSVFLTKSVPPGHVVTMKSPELKIRSHSGQPVVTDE